jgi:hypothetical protein
VERTPSSSSRMGSSAHRRNHPRLERRGLLVGLKFMQITQNWPAGIMRCIRVNRSMSRSPHITSSPVAVMVREGKQAIEVVRKDDGRNKPGQRRAGTIRRFRRGVGLTWFMAPMDPRRLLSR